MTPDDQRRGDERPEDLEWRLHAMLAQRAEAVESDLSGPALRARAGHRSAVRRYLPPVAAAAAVAAVAIGIALAGSGGEQHPAPAGGGTGNSVATPASRSTDASTGPSAGTPTPKPTPSPTRTRTPDPSASTIPIRPEGSRPRIAQTNLPAPGRLSQSRTGSVVAPSRSPAIASSPTTVP